MKYNIRNIDEQKEKVVKNQNKTLNILRRKNIFKSKFYEKNAEEIKKMFRLFRISKKLKTKGTLIDLPYFHVNILGFKMKQIKVITLGRGLYKKLYLLCYEFC